MRQIERTGPAANGTGSQDGNPATESVQREAARRRHQLHYRLVVRRRISAELDELLAEIGNPVSDPEPGVEGDYWHDSHMDLGIPERDKVGRQLLAVGWRPR